MLSKFVIVNEESEIVNSLDFNTSDLSKIPKIKFKMLEEKLKNINLDYKEIFDYYSLLMGKTSFLKSNMIMFNNKVHSLFNKKGSKLRMHEGQIYFKS